MHLRRRNARGKHGSLARAAALAALVVSGATSPAPAQHASPFVASDHWLHDALRQLDGLRLLEPGIDPSTRSVPEAHAGRLLRGAVRAAAGTPYEGVARSYLDRFVEEFGDRWAGPGDERSAVALAAVFGLGFDAETGGVTSGSGYRNGVNWTGPRAVPSSDAAVSAVELRAYAGRHAAGRIAATLSADSVRLGEAYALLALRKIGVWLGRRAIGFGPAAGGGIVLSPARAFAGGGIELLEGLTLPGFLRHVGLVRARMILSSVDENGAIRDPWFWAGRVSVQPHARLVIGLSRAAMFGGSGNTPLRLQDVLFVMIGKHAGGGSAVDNQVAAVDVWYRVPFGAVPLSLYAEWGFEDSAGAWRDVPGIIVGGEIASVPGAPGVALGIERASFAPVCCGNPIWYRHWRFLDGWAADGRPLGHSLGGHGTEWRVFGRAAPWDARLRLRAEGFVRDRGEENLFAPDRAGESLGAVLEARVRASARLELQLRGLHERGDSGWREWRLEASGRVLVR